MVQYLRYALICFSIFDIIESLHNTQRNFERTSLFLQQEKYIHTVMRQHQPQLNVLIRIAAVIPLL